MGPTMYITKNQLLAISLSYTSMAPHSTPGPHLLCLHLRCQPPCIASAPEYAWARSCQASLEDARGHYHPHRVSIFKIFEAKSSALSIGTNNPYF
jgi:hypothetical protein